MSNTLSLKATKTEFEFICSTTDKDLSFEKFSGIVLGNLNFCIDALIKLEQDDEEDLEEQKPPETHKKELAIPQSSAKAGLEIELYQ